MQTAYRPRVPFHLFLSPNKLFRPDINVKLGMMAATASNHMFSTLPKTAFLCSPYSNRISTTTITTAIQCPPSHRTHTKLGENIIQPASKSKNDTLSSRVSTTTTGSQHVVHDRQRRGRIVSVLSFHPPPSPASIRYARRDSRVSHFFVCLFVCYFINSSPTD